MNEYVEAPNQMRYTSLAPSIFLAGSISNARDWQKDATELLLPHFSVINPRRVEFDITNKEVEIQQITWEYTYLDRADVILFWFSNETVAPITLFELGKHINKYIFIGIDPDYPRRSDVEIQMGLARPEVPILYDLDLLCEEIIANKLHVCRRR